MKNKSSFCRGGINPNLTKRELDVLYLLAHGRPIKESGVELGHFAKDLYAARQQHDVQTRHAQQIRISSACRQTGHPHGA